MPAEGTDKPTTTVTTVTAVTLDCSVAIPWIIQEQSNASIDTLFQDGYRGAMAFIVPVIWFTECGNIFNEMVKRKRLTLLQAQEGFATLRYARMQVDSATTSDTQSRTLSLAQTHSLSYYDATYLELAQRRNTLLATLDDKLKAAAIATGIHCISL